MLQELKESISERDMLKNLSLRFFESYLGEEYWHGYENKYMGISKVGEKGQIVIPKEVRDIFDINSGDSLIVLADSKKGIALVKSDVIEDVTNNILGGSNDKDK